MSFGLQVFNAAGQKVFDSGRLFRFHSKILVNNTNFYGTLTVPVSGITNDGSWYVYIKNNLYGSDYGYSIANDAILINIEGSYTVHNLIIFIFRY